MAKWNKKRIHRKEIEDGWQAHLCTQAVCHVDIDTHRVYWVGGWMEKERVREKEGERVE